MKTTFFLIATEMVEGMGIRALLDMLRYDGARVESNPPGGFYLFSCEGAPTPERWRSFGVVIHLGRDVPAHLQS